MTPEQRFSYEMPYDPRLSLPDAMSVRVWWSPYDNVWLDDAPNKSKSTTLLLL